MKAEIGVMQLQAKEYHKLSQYPRAKRKTWKKREKKEREKGMEQIILQSL